MRLARLVDDGPLWHRIMASKTGNSGALPTEAFRAFMPSAKDQCWLSLFSFSEEDDLDLVAAALKYREGSIAACHFVSAEIEQIEEAELILRKTPGETYHPNVNSFHFEINIPDANTLNKVLSVFYSGEYHRVELPTVQKKLEVSAENDNIDLSSVLAKISGNVATRTMELARDKYLVLQAKNSAGNAL